MKTYSVLYAEDVPHYCAAEVEAENDDGALEKAKDHPNTGHLNFDDPDWNNPVCFRIVHIEDENGNTVFVSGSEGTFDRTGRSS